MIKDLILVGVGGGAGSALRYLTGRLVQQGTFPWATFTVNVAGSFIIGILAAKLTQTGGYSDTCKLLFITGFCGGFTTFSAFSLENINLLQQGKLGMALSYTFASIIVSLLACFAVLKLFT